jgi:hypothetical protein
MFSFGRPAGQIMVMHSQLASGPTADSLISLHDVMVICGT